MKRLPIITAAALFAMLTLQQSVLANTVYVPMYVNQPGVQVGVPSAELGGATVYADGSFTNNGVSWNGADPSGGATGILPYGDPVWRSAPAFYQPAPVMYRPVVRAIRGFRRF